MIGLTGLFGHADKTQNREASLECSHNRIWSKWANDIFASTSSSLKIQILDLPDLFLARGSLLRINLEGLSLHLTGPGAASDAAMFRNSPTGKKPSAPAL